jgi:hypothetical protein
MDFDGFNCGQAIDTINNVEIEYIDPTFTYKWCAVHNPKNRFRDIEVAEESYLFLKDKFYGKILAITGKDNLNALLRHLKKNLTGKYEENVNDNFFQHPIDFKDGSWVFIEPDQVIIYKRYSVHLGQIHILCRDMWEKAMDLKLEQTQK